MRLARTSDPQTSQDAADHAMSKINELQRAALVAVECRPGRTALEMEQLDGVMRSTYGRRMTELRRKGFVREIDKRRCSISGRSAITWGLTVAGSAELSR